MKNMPDHHPRRGDQFEAWIKFTRDQHRDPRQPRPVRGLTDAQLRSEAGWEALDHLLDEYRLAADTGQTLEEIVNEDPPDLRPDGPEFVEKKSAVIPRPTLNPPLEVQYRTKKKTRQTPENPFGGA
jgi:hypothetical protein